MKTVLITGGAGYIGAHTCKALAASGYTPVTIDNLSLGHEKFVKWGPLVIGNIHDRDLVAETIKVWKIEAVIHFAALAYVGESALEPSKYYHENVSGTLALLDAMRQANCDKIVFSSSCAVYGSPETIPISEDAPKFPINPYGRTKLVCEQMLGDFERAYAIRSVALRYFNAAGADPDGEIGELRDPETHIIPRALMHLQGHASDFKIFGSDFPTPDGTAIRDYIHVCDLAYAHIRAMQMLLCGHGSDAFNLGTGKGRSVLEILSEIGSQTGHHWPAIMGQRRQGDPAILIADAQKTRKELGFDPKMSDLETIISTAWKWHRSAHPKIN